MTSIMLAIILNLGNYLSYGGALKIPAAHDYDNYSHPSWLSQCSYIYLDLGSSRGVQIRKFFEPEKYPEATILATFDKYFGKFRATNENCVLGMEPDPRLLNHLQKIESAYRAKGWNVHIYPFAASDKDSVSKFIHCDGSDIGSCSYVTDKTQTDANRPQEKNISEVKTVSLVDFIGSLPKGSVRLMKMDIEGSEYKAIPAMTKENMLCKNTLPEIYGEGHPSQEHKIKTNEEAKEHLLHFLDKQTCIGDTTDFFAFYDSTFIKDGMKLGT